MTGVGVTIKVDDQAVRRALAAIATFGDSRTVPALEEIGEAMVSSTRRRFGREESPAGISWKPSKRALRDGGKTLQDTRRLLNSMVSQLIGGSARGVEWGTNVVYAAIHQLGGVIQKYQQSRPIYRNVKNGEIQPGFVKRRRSNFESWHPVTGHTIRMPARPFLGVDAADQGEIAEILTRHLLAAMTGRAPGAAA